jgi:hypothetical protein
MRRLSLLTASILAVGGAGSDLGIATPRGCELARPQTVAIGMDKTVRRLHVRVEKVVFQRCFWRADVRILNTAPVPVWINPGFALLVTDATVPRFGALPRLDATFFSRPLPRRLWPGERWSGTFGGQGVPRHRTRVSLALGVFISKSLCPGCLGFGVTSKEFAWPPKAR